VFAANCKIFLRGHRTISAILALALLVAIVSSMHSIINYINERSEALVSLVQIGETYLLMNRDAESIVDSQVDADLAESLIKFSEVKWVFPQKIINAYLEANMGILAVRVRILEDVGGFLKFRGARMNGAVAKSLAEVNIGEVLARVAGISVNDTINLLYKGETFTLRVAGIFTSQTELDAEVIAPMKGHLHIEDERVSIIEFSLKENMDEAGVISRIAEALPETVRVVKVQQPGNFIRRLNEQTIIFLNVWSLAVYAVVAAASYMISARLTVDSSYELAMLRALGARGRQILTLIITYMAIIAFLGSILGIALGLVGAQVISTIFRWLQPTVELLPFLKIEETAKMLALTLVSSILGCMYPALKASRSTYAEQPL